MWCCSVVGFFSIVRKGGHVHVRARSAEDIERLKKLTGIQSKTLMNHATDYEARIIVNDTQLLRIMEKLAETVEYENFKSEVFATGHQRDKLPAYHVLWHGLQAPLNEVLTIKRKAKRRQVAARKGFTSAPTLEQLKPTPRELARMDELIAWQERSAKSTIVLGVPMEDQ